MAEIRRDVPSEGGENRFRWFVTLWVMAFSFHFFDRQPFDAWPVLLAGLPCLAIPGSARLFAIFVAVSTWVVWLHLPAASNHLVLAMFANLALAMCGVLVMARDRSVREGPHDAHLLRTRWLDLARAPVGLTLLVVYFFAIFHKLNAGFFDPRVSCAGTQLRKLIRINGLDVSKLPEDVIVANAFLTMIVEGLILLAIAVPQIQRWGVLVGVVFHTGLAAARFFDFAGIVFAVYVLLAPPEVMSGIRNAERLRRFALAGWGAHALASIGAATAGSAASPLGLRWHTLQVLTWVAAVFPMVAPLVIAWCRSDAGRLPWSSWRVSPAALLALPAAAFLNGTTGYLGIKTVANYSMFSNLRTEEGDTNHFFPAMMSLEVTNFQRDTAEVLAIDLPPEARPRWGVRLRGGMYWIQRQTRWSDDRLPVRIPWIELRRAVVLWKDAGLHGIRLRYSRGGIERDVPDATLDPELAAPLPWWIRKFVAFREIEPEDEPVSCRW